MAEGGGTPDNRVGSMGNVTVRNHKGNEVEDGESNEMAGIDEL